jgi:hypothetical protein
MLRGLQWQVGNGQHISLWFDSWSPCGSVHNQAQGPLTEAE